MSGQKNDDGKVRAGLVLGDFASALYGVSLVGTFGANKYSASNWLQVKDAKKRYNDAMMRHWLEAQAGHAFDDESDIIHLAHVAWNALAILELELRDGSVLTKAGMETPYEYKKGSDTRTRAGHSRPISSPMHDPSVEC